MLPSIESLRCFVEAARLLNFRAAARSVALTPAALGQRIRQLEEQLGTPLFHRTTRTVVLTQAGLALLPHARAALDAAESCFRAGRGEIAPPAIELTLGTRYELGLSWVLPMLSRLHAARPGLTLHLYFGSGSDLLIRVRTLEVDCAIGSMRIVDPRLDWFRLHREEYVFVAHPALLRERPLRKASDARQHTLIDVNPTLPLYGYLRDAPGGERMEFARILFRGTGAAIHAAVRDGLGVAVMPRYMVEHDLRARRIVPVLPSRRLSHDYFRLIFRKDDPRRSLYEALANVMLQVPLA